jgi:hypothetical protein
VDFGYVSIPAALRSTVKAIWFARSTQASEAFDEPIVLGRSHRAHGDCQRTIELRRAEGHEERGLLSIQPRRVRPGRDADDSQ